MDHLNCLHCKRHQSKIKDEAHIEMTSTENNESPSLAQISKERSGPNSVTKNLGDPEGIKNLD